MVEALITYSVGNNFITELSLLFARYLSGVMTVDFLTIDAYYASFTNKSSAL